MKRDITEILQSGQNPEDFIKDIDPQKYEEAKMALSGDREMSLQEIETNLKSYKALRESHPDYKSVQDDGVDVQDIVQRIQESFVDGAPPPRSKIELPWKNINEAIGGGLYPGTYVLVGNTGTGKSQWALQAALHAAGSTSLNGEPKEPTPVLYIALELGAEDLVYRLAGMIVKRPWSELWKGEFEGHSDLKQRRKEKFRAALEEISKRPLQIVTGKAMGWPYDRMEGLIESMIEKHNGKPPLVVVDFLQLIASPQTKREDIRERIQNTSYVARTVSKELGATVILISSTARDNYKKLNGTDSKSSAEPWRQPATFCVGLGKESGEIEYAADGVFVLAKPSWDENTPERERDTVYFGVAKLRDHKTGDVPWPGLNFRGNLFSEAQNNPKNQDKRVLTCEKQSR